MSDADAKTQAATWIIERGHDFTPAILGSAERAMGKREAHERDGEISPAGITSASFRGEISNLKCRMVEYPRDAISACQLSRLYTVAGQRDKAIGWMEHATRLAPENRYVLRGNAQLFTHLGVPERALEVIWRSNAVRHDPWIQAAEAAVADAAGRSPKWAHKQRAHVSNSAPEIKTSELALGLATLDEKAGSARRNVVRLVQKGLGVPTENAVAQAIWLDTHNGGQFNTPGSLAKVDFAGEANARQAMEVGDFAGALVHCEGWIADEPYSVPANLIAGILSGSYLEEFNRAIQFYRTAHRLDPANAFAINGLIVSFCYAGMFNKAAEYYSKFLSLREEAGIAPYVYAAEGLMAFKQGDVNSGRAAYLLAVRSALKMQPSGIDIIATAYWMEQEAANGSLPETVWDKIATDLDGRVQKVAVGLRSSVGRLWALRRTVIERLVNEKGLIRAKRNGIGAGLEDFHETMLSNVGLR